MADRSSSSTRQNSGWRSLRRNLARASFLLIGNLVRLVTPTSAFPTSSSTSTSSSTAAASPTASPVSGDRNGPFQILADGTQDIAALVGIFATDSVEKYAIDYSRGYLGPAVSHLSLLGLLGYVRLLVKLGLGPDRCRKAGLDLKALRPMFGIQDEDYVPVDRVREVCYVERKIEDEWVSWRVKKRIKHTGDSFTLVARLGPSGQNQDEYPRGIGFWYLSGGFIHHPKFYILFSRVRDEHRHILIAATHHLVLLLLSILCAGLTCFCIIPFVDALENRPWTFYWATLGLFCPVVISNMMWTWVHMREHHPHHRVSDWYYCGVGVERGSLYKKSTFALSQGVTHFAIYDVKVVGGGLRKMLQIFSLLASLSILVGYTCQYIEVRRLTTTDSGIWLAIQGVLAITRVAVWVWDPEFDNIKPLPLDDGLGIYHLTEVRMIALCATSVLHRRHDLRIPKWALPAFQVSYWDRKGMFGLARKLRHDNSEWDTSFDVLQSAECFWNLPHKLFMTWTNNFVRPNSHLRRERGSEFSCKVVKDNRGKFHFLPAWIGSILFVACRTDQGAILTDDELENPNVLAKLSATGVRVADASVYVLGDPNISKRCIFAVEPNGPFRPGTIPFKQQLVVGWESPLLKEVLISLQAGLSPDVNLDDRFLDEAHEVKLMYSFLNPAFTSCDDEERTSDSTWTDPEPIDRNKSPNYISFFHSFDDVRRTTNSMWEELDRITKYNSHENPHRSPAASADPQPPTTAGTDSPEELPTRGTGGDVELQTLGERSTTADERDQGDAPEAESQRG